MLERTFKIFLVDDDVKTLIMLKSHLEKRIEHNIKVNIFAHGENCLDKMELNPDIIVLDYHLDAIRETAKPGIDILKVIKQINPNTEVVMMSGQEDMDTALKTIRHGAYDYIIKNEKAMQRLELLVNKIIIQKNSKEEKEGSWLGSLKS